MHRKRVPEVMKADRRNLRRLECGEEMPVLHVVTNQRRSVTGRENKIITPSATCQLPGQQFFQQNRGNVDLSDAPLCLWFKVPPMIEGPPDMKLFPAQVQV